MNMRSFKAPGPDGFQPFFFKHYWHLIGDDIWRLVQNAFSFGSFDPRLAETLITLIPKGESPTHLRNFRPISLCNVAYKVISKVLVNNFGLSWKRSLGHFKVVSYCIEVLLIILSLPMK